MIVSMRRLDLLLYHRERDAFLRELQDLGVVHIVENPDKDPTTLQATAALVKRCEHALTALKGAGPQPGPGGQLDGPAVLERFEELEASRQRLEQELQQLVKDEAAVEPWGEFDPGLIEKLAGRGIRLRFFKTDLRRFQALENGEYAIAPVLQLSGIVYFVVAGFGEPVIIDALELFPPMRSLARIRAAANEIRSRIGAVQSDIQALSEYREALAAYCSRQQNRYSSLSAALDLTELAGGALISLTGWVPAEREKTVAAFLGRFTAWYEFSDPTPGDDVPVLLKNGPFSRLFEPITKLFSLPSYAEFDPTPLFAPFFALYVGLCLGDIAYGLIIFSGAALLNRRVNPQFKPLCKLIMVLGASTTISGMLLNSFFGQTLFGGPGIPQDSALLSWGARFFSPLTPVPGPRGTVYPMMSFAILLGFLQVVFALGTRAAGSISRQGFAAGLMPIAYIMCLFGTLIWGAAVNFMNLGIPSFSVGSLKIGPLLTAFPLWSGKALLFAGLAIMFLFNNPDKKVFIRLPLGLWELFGFATGIFSDILSYLRLFALGLCGGMLGASFNMLALRIITPPGGTADFASPLVVISALVFLIGHSLNFVLSIVGAFVHPLRLTFVEFYKNLDFQGGGKPYAPLSSLRPDSQLAKTES